MTKEEVRILSIQFQGEEVDIWNSFIEKLSKISEAGYKKTFSLAEIELIRELNEKEEN